MFGKILFFEAIAASRITLRTKLARAGYNVVSAPTVASLPSLAAQQRPDIAVIDIDHDTEAAVAACSNLTAAMGQTGPEIIVLASRGSADGRLAAMEAGALTIVDKPVDEDFLMAALRKILRDRRALRPMDDGVLDDVVNMREAPGVDLCPPRLCILSEDRAAAAAWRARLGRRAPNMQVCGTTPGALMRLEDPARVTDLFLLVASARDTRQAPRLLADIRSRFGGHGARIATMFKHGTGRSEDDSAAMAYDLGADDVFTGGEQEPEIIARIKSQIARRRRAQALDRQLEAGLRLAMRDPLTGAYNRRFAESKVARLTHTAGLTGASFSILALDLDRFKAVNDTYGHAAGDHVLVDVSERIARQLRPMDILVRSGGEEFWAILPETGSVEADRVARRIGTAIRTSPVVLPDGQGIVRVTVSIGVSVATHGTVDAAPDTVIARADAALYRAKADGRDTVTRADAAA